MSVERRQSFRCRGGKAVFLLCFAVGTSACGDLHLPPRESESALEKDSGKTALAIDDAPAIDPWHPHGMDAGTDATSGDNGYLPHEAGGGTTGTTGGTVPDAGNPSDGASDATGGETTGGDAGTDDDAGDGDDAGEGEGDDAGDDAGNEGDDAGTDEDAGESTGGDSEGDAGTDEDAGESTGGGTEGDATIGDDGGRDAAGDATIGDDGGSSGSDGDAGSDAAPDAGPDASGPPGPVVFAHAGLYAAGAVVIVDYDHLPAGTAVTLRFTPVAGAAGTGASAPAVGEGGSALLGPLPAGVYTLCAEGSGGATLTCAPGTLTVFSAVPASPVGQEPDVAPAPAPCTGTTTSGARQVLCVDGRNAGSAVGSAAHPFRLVQDAIDACNDGDVVQVAAGIYAEHVTIVDKRLVLLGGYPGAAAIAYAGGAGGVFTTRDRQTNLTTLRAATTANGDNGPAVKLVSAGASVVSGFRITGGTGRSDGSGRFEGGGIYVGDPDGLGGKPLIANNTIEQNDLRIPSAGPSGLLGRSGRQRVRQQHGLLLLHCQDDPNVPGATKCAEPDPDTWRGAGVMIDSTPALVLNNIVQDNQGGRGNGLAVLGGGDALVRGNVFRRNLGYSNHGGGVYLLTPTVLFEQNVVASNEVGLGARLRVGRRGVRRRVHRRSRGLEQGLGDVSGQPRHRQRRAQHRRGLVRRQRRDRDSRPRRLGEQPLHRDRRHRALPRRLRRDVRLRDAGRCRPRDDRAGHLHHAAGRRAQRHLPRRPLPRVAHEFDRLDGRRPRRLRAARRRRARSHDLLDRDRELLGREPRLVRHRRARGSRAVESAGADRWRGRHHQRSGARGSRRGRLRPSLHRGPLRLRDEHVGRGCGQQPDAGCRRAERELRARARAERRPVQPGSHRQHAVREQTP